MLHGTYHSSWLTCVSVGVDTDNWIFESSSEVDRIGVFDLWRFAERTNGWSFASIFCENGYSSAYLYIC